DPALHVAGQVGPAAEHLRGRRPVGPFALGTDAVHAAPAEAVSPDADAVAESRAARLHQIEPPLGGVEGERARRVIAGLVNAGARNGADADRAEATVASEEAGPAILLAEVKVALGLRLTRAGQQCRRGSQNDESSGHCPSSPEKPC